MRNRESERGREKSRQTEEEINIRGTQRTEQAFTVQDIL